MTCLGFAPVSEGPVVWTAGPQVAPTGVRPLNERILLFALNAENRGIGPEDRAFDHERSFWSALIAPRNEVLDALMPLPSWPKVLMRLPESPLGGPGAQFSWIAHLDASGDMIESLQDSNGHYGVIASVNEYDGNLYLGNRKETAIGRLAIAATAP